MLIKMNNDIILCSEGLHNAVLAAVYSIGLQLGGEDEEPKHKHVYVFELDEIIPDGEPVGTHYIASGIYNDSLSGESRLTSIIHTLKGGLTDQEMKSGFDPESLIGLNCTLLTVNKPNVLKAMPTIVSFFKGDSSEPLMTPTYDWSKMPDWVKRLQDQRLDK